MSLEDGPEAVVLHVDDDDDGVPEQRLEQIFEPRFRLSPRGQGWAGPGHRAQPRRTPMAAKSVCRTVARAACNLRLPRLGLE